ncbi:Por secretion system C-terminal sorting domain-containing protein [Flavobacterium caeni]|uniref:Por secretion system C-terminal sorting domain-containing protein n=2 Tax=Flavobacterium caeni TaxID=490189 RepID=A0A1G5CC66_9FLAO|nr:Por secretion system C-terminal sorting domain-containing protein [Flavobacterium caeni]
MPRSPALTDFTWRSSNENLNATVMKKIYSIVILMLSLGVFAQPPAGYYNSATGTGYVLKTQLYNIIKGHDDRGYAGLYVTYTTSDKDFYYENNGTMLDMYTENPNGPECEFTYGVNQDDGTLGTIECQRYNREHLVPQSVFNAATPMYSDAHFVVPSDKHVNAVRGDLPFGKVNVANFTGSNGTKRGSNLNSGYSAGYTGTVFEPIDEFKGDIARMLLYFATRYENVVSGYSYVMFNGTSTQVFTNPFKNILLTWNAQDPVSAREIARNNAIFARQENRNPYIDNNAWVTAIWGSPPLQVEAFEILSSATVYPNPTHDRTLHIESGIALDQVELIAVSGQTIRSIDHPQAIDRTYTLTDLPSGFYFLRLISGGQSTVKKVQIY